MKKTILIMALALGCPGIVSAAPAYTQAVASYGSVVYSHYTAAFGAAQHMQKAIESFLAQPNQQTLDAARLAWVQARQPYLMTEAYRFYEGPIDAPETGPGGRINAWPVNEAFIDYVQEKPKVGIVQDLSLPMTLDTILGKDKITDEADVTTGWHAIEFLLWGQDLDAAGPGNRPWQDFLAGDPVRDRRRGYLRLVTQQMVTDLGNLAAAWHKTGPNYRQDFTAQPQKALGHILTALATLSGFELASERLMVPLNSRSQEDEHSCFSDTTTQDYRYNHQGIEHVYFGRLADGSVPSDMVSLDRVIRDRDPVLADKIVVALAATSGLIQSFHQPFDQILAAPVDSPLRKPVADAVTALEHQAALFVEAGKLLGVQADILSE